LSRLEVQWRATSMAAVSACRFARDQPAHAKSLRKPGNAR